MASSVAAGDTEDLQRAAQLLHDFNIEYDEEPPPPGEIAVRLTELVTSGHIVVLLARDSADTAVGVAVMRVQPSVWSRGAEAYLAELYVVPGRRGQGFGRELITEAITIARQHDADYAFVITSEEDTLAQRLYEAAGFRRTEGEAGPVMWAYEREL